MHSSQLPYNAEEGFGIVPFLGLCAFLNQPYFLISFAAIPYLLVQCPVLVSRFFFFLRCFRLPWTEETRLTDIDFADNISLLAETRDSLQELTTNLETEAKKVGLRISAQKTKTMQIGGEQAITPLNVSQQTIQNVDRFTYLGSILTEDN